jgi:RNase P subunit RPR2
MADEEANRYLRYEAAFQVLICLNCQHCLTPGGVENHLRRVHQWMPIAVRKELVKYSKGLIIAQTGEARTPLGEIDAIEGLKVTKGVICDSCEAVLLPERNASNSKAY